jgi:hypothetical protein
MAMFGSCGGVHGSIMTSLMLLCAGGLIACDQGSGSKGAAAVAEPSGVAAAVEKRVDDAVEKAGGKLLFDPSNKDVRKRACEFLTADMVSKQFGVPAGELEQRKLMGCMYTWSKDGQVLDAKLMTIQVHRTDEMAQTWFHNSTATKTKKQLDAEMDLVKKEAQKRKELDTDLKKKTAGTLTDIMKMGSPKEGVSYDDVPGIADEARTSNKDGSLWMRLGNVTFHVAAYKGPEQPRPKFDLKNPKGIAKAAMEAQKAWLKETLAERKAASKKLAPLVVAAMKGASK